MLDKNYVVGNFLGIELFRFLMPNMTCANGGGYYATKIDSTSTQATVVCAWLLYTRYPPDKDDFWDTLHILTVAALFAWRALEMCTT